MYNRKEKHSDESQSNTDPESGLASLLSTLSKKKETGWCRNRLVCYAIFFFSSWIVISIIYSSKNLFPETEMVINSSCKRPLQNWDGKILDVPVWYSGYSDRPDHFNLHNEKDYQSKEKPLIPLNKKKPIVIWGTHHKTGTFLAKKLFSKICSTLEWCCLFHVTRDSVFAVENALETEPINAMGHNQWIWHPHELNITNYKFIHFYRNPLRKVVSGYSYHYDGTEQWTQKPLEYEKICPLTNNFVQSIKNSNESAIVPISKHQVFDYCSGIHLCETCCRRDHEYFGSDNSLSDLRVATDVYNTKEYRLRSPQEYEYICNHLGRMNGSSIQQTLMNLPPREGILVEAALDYYENLRMAKLVNLTANDPDTLNIDLDYLTRNYQKATMKILTHLKDLIPKKLFDSIHDDLQFYNLETSTLYRWSMSNPIINHVTSTKEKKESNGVSLTSKELFKILQNDPTVMKLYQPLLDSMHQVISRHD